MDEQDTKVLLEKLQLAWIAPNQNTLGTPLAILTTALREAKAQVYQEVADEFHVPLVREFPESARGICAQLEAIFLRRATEMRTP